MNRLLSSLPQPVLAPPIAILEETCSIAESDLSGVNVLKHFIDLEIARLSLAEPLDETSKVGAVKLMAQKFEELQN